MADVSEEYLSHFSSKGTLDPLNPSFWKSLPPKRVMPKIPVTSSGTCLSWPDATKHSCPGVQLYKPPEEHVNSPWIRVKLSSGDFDVTVGNKSAPDRDNTVAVIGLNYGASSGTRCTIDIVDEEGGSLSHFFNKGLARCLRNVDEFYKVEVQFGWMGINCGASKPTPKKTDWTLYFLCIEIGTEFAEGKIKYHLTCIDLMGASDVGKIMWSSKVAISLKQAIIQYLDAKGPSVDVAFLRRTPGGGSPTPWAFSMEGVHVKAIGTPDNPAAVKTKTAPGEGPIYTWESKGGDKLETLRDWLSDKTTDKDKGFIPQWDAMAKKPTLIIWEDFLPHCSENIDCLDNMGTFLVNAGKCSNVLSFHPTINWIAGVPMLQMGGNSGGTSTAKPTKADNKPPTCKDLDVEKKIGSHTSTVASDQTREQVPTNKDSDANTVTKKGNFANALAAMADVIKPIEAELRIIGLPIAPFIDQKIWRGKHISIVVVNPFSLSYSENNDCGDWTILANTTTNDILTNKNWFLQGVTHSIQGGKYVTILKVYLVAPAANNNKSGYVGNDDTAIKIEKCP